MPAVADAGVRFSGRMLVRSSNRHFADPEKWFSDPEKSAKIIHDMNFPIYITKDELLDHFKPLADALHEVMLAIMEERVKPYFDQDGLFVDDTLASPMVRHATKLRLATIFPVPLDESDDPDSPPTLIFKHLRNHGIESIFRGLPFKLLRGRKGRIPPPGDSEYRTWFYNNDLQIAQPSLFDPTPELLWRRLHPRVLILWDFDPAYNVLTLWLVVPDKATAPYGEVTWVHRVEVPPPDDQAALQPTDMEPIPTPDLDVETRKYEPVEEPRSEEEATVEDREEGE